MNEENRGELLRRRNRQVGALKWVGAVGKVSLDRLGGRGTARGGDEEQDQQVLNRAASDCHVHLLRNV